MTAEHDEGLMKIGNWPEGERRFYEDLATCAAHIQPAPFLDELAESVGRHHVPEQFAGTPDENKAAMMMSMLFGCAKAHPATSLFGASHAGNHMGLEGADVWSYAEAFAHGYAEHQAYRWQVIAEENGWDWNTFFARTNENAQEAMEDWFSLVPFACEIGLENYFGTVPPEGWEPPGRPIYGEDVKGIQIVKGGEGQ